MLKHSLLAMLTALLGASAIAQQPVALTGTVRVDESPARDARVLLLPDSLTTLCNESGFFNLGKLKAGNYDLQVNFQNYPAYRKTLLLGAENQHLDIDLADTNHIALADMVIVGSKNVSVSGKLKDVSGTAIYAGKKTELINMEFINGNLATNNTRQIYARVPGLNIWEYDRGGLQLGIGGRGLSPNRSSNFNIRQNGYDISADALGYPESYYTPSAEALSKIEIIRGAASLQYGPQFGGLVNFVMKEGPKDVPFQWTTRQSLGSYGFFNSFNSVGGTTLKNKLNYYSFYQYKQGDDWRPNSHYAQHNGYVHLAYQFTPKLRVTGEYTLMEYLAQQPGGLTDAQFAEDASVSVRARNWFRVNWNLFSLSLDYAFNDNTRINWRSYTLQGGRDALGVLNYINRPDNGGNRDLLTDDYSNFGSEFRLIHQYKLLQELKSTFLVGTRLYRGLTDRKQGNADSGSEANFTFNGPEPDKSSFKFPGSNLALFAENIFQLNEHWSVTPGIRFEHINTRAKGYYYKQNIFIPSEKIQEEKANPRSFALLGIGSSWKFNHGTELYGNVSQNFRSINFNDIRVSNINARVDPALKDETGYNIDLGFRGTYHGWLYLDVSAFYLRYNDRIGSIFTRDSSFMTYRLRTNVSDSRNLGMELLLEGDLLKVLAKNHPKYKLNLYTNLSLIDARYIHTQNTAIAGKLVENVPPVLFRTGISFGTPQFNLTYQFSFQTRQYSDATNTDITPTAVDGLIPAFSVMDLSLSYKWRMLTLYTGVNNLANRKYFTRRADGYPGPGIIPADRRGFYVTLEGKF